MAIEKNVLLRFLTDTAGLKGIGVDGDKASRALASVEGATSKAKKEIGELEKGITNLIKKYAGWAAAGAALTKVIRGAITFSKDFEKGLSKLSSITGKTGYDLDKLGDAAKELSLNFGTSAIEIVDAFAKIGSNQPELLKNPAALIEVTKQADILANALGIGVAEAGDILTGSLNAFGKSAGDAGKFIDILASSQKEGAATADLIAESLKNVGSTAATVGLSFEDTNVALQALAVGNLKGAEAGTALRGILRDLAKTGRDDLNPALTPLPKIVDTLSKEVKTLTGAQEIFTAEAASAALTLINQKDVVNNLTGALNQQGEAFNQATINSKNLNGDIDKLTAQYTIFVDNIANNDGVITKFLRGAAKEASLLLTAFELFNERGISGLDRNLAIQRQKQKLALDELERRIKSAESDGDSIIALQVSNEQTLIDQRKALGQTEEEAIENTAAFFITLRQLREASELKAISDAKKRALQLEAFQKEAADKEKSLAEKRSKELAKIAEKARKAEIKDLKEIDKLLQELIQISDEANIDFFKDSIEETKRQNELLQETRKLIEGLEDTDQGEIEFISSFEQRRAAAIASGVDVQKQLTQIERDEEIFRLELKKETIEEGTQARLEAENALNLAIYENQKELEQQQAEDRAQQYQDILNIVENYSELIVDQFAKVNQANLDNLDDSINEQQKRVDKALEIAGEGNAELVELERDRLEKLQAQREAALEREQQIARAQAALSAFSSIAQAIPIVLKAFGEGGNVLEGIATIAGIIAAIAQLQSSINSTYSSLPSFDVGTDFLTGERNADAIPIIAHRGERILTAEQNKELSRLGIKNQDIPSLVMRGLNMPGASKDYSGDYKKIIKQNDQMIRAFESMGFEFNVTKDGIYAAGSRYRQRSKPTKR